MKNGSLEDVVCDAMLMLMVLVDVSPSALLPFTKIGSESTNAPAGDIFAAAGRPGDDGDVEWLVLASSLDVAVAVGRGES